MIKPNLSKMAGLLLAFCMATAIGSPAQTFTSLQNFDFTHGAVPHAALLQANDGDFYGTTSLGGNTTPPSNSSGCGTVFKMTAGGTLTTLHAFEGTDGCLPYGALVQGTDGNFYGTTFSGPNVNIGECAPFGCGTVFKVTPGGTLTILHSFAATTDGSSPRAGLIQGSDGNFYGTASSGINAGCGTVFQITPGGTLTTLHTFAQTDGCSPYGGLVQASDGNFYGTTYYGGGSADFGVVFQLTPGGTLTPIYSFCPQGSSNCADGGHPVAGLLQATDGNFYGTTTVGGSQNCLNGCGTIFKITSAGTLNTLHTFDGTDGLLSYAPMIQANDGNLYGATVSGGTSVICSFGCGTVFKMTPGGTLNTLHSFDSTDGSNPQGGLMQASTGSLYGTTGSGGSTGDGTVFSLSVGLGTSGDFDGDGEADIGVFRPSNGIWFVIPSKTPNNFLVQQWGTSGDIPVRGDFDGDGKTDVAVWRPSSGEWFIIPSSNPGSPILQQWGANGDIPVPGDYDGDGKTDFAVFRPSTGTWFIIPSSNPNSAIIRQWGASGDTPVPGDYDGDGKTDIAVWRPSTGEWYIIPSSNPSSPILQQWGANGDMPVPGDYDGDGKTDIAVWRPSNGEWFIVPSSNPNSPIIQQWGTSGDLPVPGDYDGDHKTDIAVWRPSNGDWFIIPSSAPTTFTITQWGASSDIPLQKPVGQ